MHASGAYKFAKEICSLANEKEQSPRLLTYKNDGPPKFTTALRFEPYNVAYSVEECKQQLDGNCDPDANFGNKSAFIVL